jgi:probable F420-dependent oxidoreductase
MARYGMTVPLFDLPLSEHRAWLEELMDLGYTDLWTSEADAADAFTPLALAAAWVPQARLGTSIVPAYTRGPALLAQSAASMAEAAPGRFVMGVGTSSNVIVQAWNDIPFVEPYKRTRDVVRFMRRALTGERIDETFETFTVRGFRLGRIPAEPPPIVVAGLRPGMLRLAGREADGAVINWLSADDVRKVVPVVQEAWGDKPGAPEIIARIFVARSEDLEAVRYAARRAIAAYLNVPVYVAFHEWLGRGPQLKGMWDAWAAGDRKAATAAIPDEVVDDLIIHGSPEECRAKIQAYADAGVTTMALWLMSFGVDGRQAARELAPTAR